MVSEDTWSPKTTSTEIVRIKDSDTVNKRFATLYEGLDMTKRGAQLEPLLFFVRRTIIAALVVLMPTQQLIAASVLIVTTVAMLAYYLLVKPYQDAAMNKMAVANEIFLAVFTATLLVVSLNDARDVMLGWGIIALVLLIVSSNVIFILVKACSQACSGKQEVAESPAIEMDEMPSPENQNNLEGAFEQAEELPGEKEQVAPSLQIRQRQSEQPQSSGASSADDEGSSSPTTRSESQE